MHHRSRRSWREKGLCVVYLLEMALRMGWDKMGWSGERRALFAARCEKSDSTTFLPQISLRARLPPTRARGSAQDIKFNDHVGWRDTRPPAPVRGRSLVLLDGGGSWSSSVCVQGRQRVKSPVCIVAIAQVIFLTHLLLSLFKAYNGRYMNDMTTK